MANQQFRPGEFYQVPKGLHRIVKYPTDLCVLTYLLQCRNGNNACFPSYQTISQGLISRRQSMISIRRLKGAGFISITGAPYKTNTLTINIELITKLTSEMNSLPLVKPLHPNNTKLNNTKEQEDIDNVLIKKKRQGRPAEDPDKYIQGKYGHMVQR